MWPFRKPKPVYTLNTKFPTYPKDGTWTVVINNVQIKESEIDDQKYFMLVTFLHPVKNWTITKGMPFPSEEASDFAEALKVTTPADLIGKQTTIVIERNRDTKFPCSDITLL